MLALSLMGVDPIRVKRIAFAIALATCGVGGALMIIMIPIEPAVGRLYIGNVFAIVVLGGLGSISGTLIAAVLLGVAESVVSTFLGPSWSPAVSFGILLGVLAFKPSGMFGVGDTR
jgi:branched-chain amino acid transport system permease protein